MCSLHPLKNLKTHTNVIKLNSACPDKLGKLPAEQPLALPWGAPGQDPPRAGAFRPFQPEAGENLGSSVQAGQAGGSFTSPSPGSASWVCVNSELRTGGTRASETTKPELGHISTSQKFLSVIFSI